MAAKSILLAISDPQAVTDISQALGGEWMATSVHSDTEALAQIEEHSFDALLVDFNLGSPDASELLNLALEKRPETTRFLLAYEADLALVAAKVNGEHQILPKPIEFTSLKSRIEEGVAREDSNSRQSGTDSAAEASAPPKVPAIYSKVLKALESPDVTTSQVGEIIAEDAALTAEVLRLTNSVYLGLPRNITDLVEAVGSLGLETVKALVMALRFLNEHRHLKPGYLSFDKLWQHSTNVAMIARDLMLFETKDRALASEAFVAGLIHDLGKIVLVTNFDDLYGRIHSLARKQPVPIWEAEKEMFGANHGEIGGCLVGMWNLPISIVDAAALHHEPPLGEQQQLSPLAAVHIANVLEHELSEGNEFRVAPIIDSRFLNELGLLQRLPVWRAAVANGSLADTEPELATAETDETSSTSEELSSAPPTRAVNRLAELLTETRSASSGHPGRGHGTPLVPSPGRWQMRPVHFVIAAALLLFLGLWIGARLQPNQSVPVQARTTAEAPVRVSSTPSPETVLPTAPQAAPHAAAAEVTPTPSAPAALPAPLSPPQHETVLVSQPQLASTNIVILARPETPPPDFRLTGIIYSPARSSAIVNGQTVQVGSHVDGATVLSIGLDHVTLRVNGQRKTYELPK